MEERKCAENTIMDSGRGNGPDGAMESKSREGKKKCFEGHRRPGVEWEIQGNAFCSKENVLKRKKVSNAAGNEQRRHGLWLLSIVP